ncbi:hypothetical protein [Roseivirga pacifica]|uniref:hypothetical protein n=1 Tax=Roseivirga pacifica TaxID=1267423 RepID=UPI00227AFEA6|nr:hypothetical protein [Roseivirga pacifica]
MTDTRREFIIKSSLASLAILGTPNVLLSETQENDNTKLQTSDEKEKSFEIGLMAAESYMAKMNALSLDLPNDYDINRRRIAVWAYVAGRAQEVNTQHDREVFMRDVQKIVLGDEKSFLDPVRVQDVEKLFKNNQSFWEKITKDATTSTTLAAIAAASKAPRIASIATFAATTLDYLFPKLYNPTPKASPELVDAIEEIAKRSALEAYQDLKDEGQAAFEESFSREKIKDIMGIDIGLSLDEKVKKLSQKFPEMEQALKAYVDKEIKGNGRLSKSEKDEIRASIQTSVSDAVIALHKNIEQEKAKAEHEQREFQGKLYVTKFAVGELFDPQTARTITTIGDVGLNIYSLAMANAGPWAMAAGMLGGFSALRGLGSNRSGGSTKAFEAIFAALKQIMETLKVVNEKLDMIADNQRKILNEINALGDRILDQMNFNDALILQKIENLKKKLDQEIILVTTLHREEFQEKIDGSIRNIKVEVESRNPDKKELQKDLASISDYTLKNTTSAAFTRNDIKSWDSQIVYDALTQNQTLDTKIGLLKVLTQEFLGQSTNTPEQNPIAWASGTNQFVTQATTVQKRKSGRAIKKTVESLSETLRKTGVNIYEQYGALLSPGNIEHFKNEVKSVFANAVEHSITSAYEEMRRTNHVTTDLPVVPVDWIDSNRAPKVVHDINRLHRLNELGNRVEKKGTIEPIYLNNGHFLDEMTHTSQNVPKKIGRFSWGTFYTIKGYDPIKEAEAYGLISISNPYVWNERHIDNTIITITDHRISVGRHGSVTVPSRRVLDYHQSLAEGSIEGGFEKSSIVQIHFRAGNLQGKTLGSGRESGWRTSEIEVAARDLNFKNIQYLPLSLQKVKLGNYNLDTGDPTGAFLDLIARELSDHDKELRKQLNDNIRQQLDINGSIPYFKAAAQSLSYLAGLHHWYNGGNIKTATSLSVETDSLYATNEGIKHIFESVVAELPKTKADLSDSIEEQLSTKDFIIKKMTEAFNKNIDDYVHLYFPEKDEKQKPGFEESSSALRTITVFQKEGHKMPGLFI